MSKGQRPTRFAYPGNSQNAYVYDSLMRIGQFQTIDPAGNSVLDYSYQYDTLGNIETKETEHGSYSYDYDAMSRLTTVDNPTLDDEGYSYDAVGNRTRAGGVSGSITHNRNNELRHYGDISYDYDANGNLTEVRANDEVVWTYTYDAANRLVHAEDGSGSISADYYYDPFGRRLWKDVRRSAAQSLQRTYFFYSDEGLIAEYDGNGQELRSYGYKPDATWTTDPLFLKQGEEYYWYQNDHLGTPQKLTAVNGAVVWSAQYAAFGQADVQVETVVNNLRFPGQYYDVETGLHYNFHRYYHPEIGRYVRVDPVGFIGGNVNLYEYGKNNPLHFIDIKGLQQGDEIEDGEGGIDHLLEEFKRNWDTLPPEIQLDLIVRFPLDIPPSLWPGLIEGFYIINKDILRKALLDMCPTSGKIDLEPEPPCLTCTAEGCEEQVKLIVNRYMNHVKTLHLDEFQRTGNIIGGSAGNRRAGEDGASGGRGFPHQYVGPGTKCQGWVAIGYSSFVTMMETSDYRRAGEICFRMSHVAKSNWLLKHADNHEWLVIHGPRKKDPSYKDKSGPDTLIIDPWPSGGFEIIPQRHRYKAMWLANDYFYDDPQKPNQP